MLVAHGDSVEAPTPRYEDREPPGPRSTAVWSLGPVSDPESCMGPWFAAEMEGERKRRPRALNPDP